MTDGTEYQELGEIPESKVPVADNPLDGNGVAVVSDAAAVSDHGAVAAEPVDTAPEVEGSGESDADAPSAQLTPVDAADEAPTAEIEPEAEETPDAVAHGESSEEIPSVAEVVTDEDVSAAIAEAEANIEGEIAAAPSAAPSVSIWPFVVYDVIWAAFAAALIWKFSELPVGVAVYESELYPLAILGGIALTVAGPLLILAVWFWSWSKQGARKGALFVSALIKGSTATLLGVLLWCAALLVLDQMRLGRLL